MQRQGAGQEVRPQIKQFDSVQQPARLQERQGKHQNVHRHQDMNRSQHDSGQIEKGRQVTALAQQRGTLRKRQTEMQEEGGLQDPRGNVQPINRPVKQVQLAGVSKGVKNKGSQAEDIKMAGFARRPAPEKDKGADQEVK